MGNGRAFTRTESLLGQGAMEFLKKARVAIFGVGGVGGAAAEALARSGIGGLLFVDGDAVDETNINRQIIATRKTVGMGKAALTAERALEINPSLSVSYMEIFYNAKTADTIDFGRFNYIVDAVDDIPAKILIIEKAKAAGVPVISSMGTGNKLNPCGFTLADISQTSVCPLARVMRKELQERGITGVTVVYSKEQPVKKITPPGSVAFVPAAAGLLIASKVVRDIAGV